MNRKGFATILSLCLLLAMAFVVRGIQISERNHVYESAMDFTAEFELQNAAESALITAVEKIRNGDITLTRKLYTSRKKNQQSLGTMTIDSERLDTITVKTWGEKVDIQSYKVSYGTNDEDNVTATKNNTATAKGAAKTGYFVFSLAEATNPQTGGKIYRRAVACIFDNDTTIYYMDIKQSNYKVK